MPVIRLDSSGFGPLAEISDRSLAKAHISIERLNSCLSIFRCLELFQDDGKRDYRGGGAVIFLVSQFTFGNFHRQPASDRGTRS